MKVAICGGGSLAHATAAVLGAHPDVKIRVLTRQPRRWSKNVHGLYLDIAEVVGQIALATDDVGEAVTGADLVLVCVPACAREAMLASMAPYLASHAWVGGLPGFGGFDWQARESLGPEARIFGLQRVPFVRRTISYGEAVWISGIRPRLILGARPAERAVEIAALVQALFSIPTDPLPHYLPVTLSASNPLFHPARIYSAFAGSTGRTRFADRPLFYEEWNDAASAAFLALDDELQSICSRLPLDMSAAQPIRLHYGAADAQGLTRRIRELRPLRDRYLPLVATKAGYEPDVRAPYFTEDVPYGLLVVKGVAEAVGLPTPQIDVVLKWAQAAMERCYLDGDRATGKDCAGLPLPARFGIAGVGDLVAQAF